MGGGRKASPNDSVIREHICGLRGVPPPLLRQRLNFARMNTVSALFVAIASLHSSNWLFVCLLAKYVCESIFWAHAAFSISIPPKEAHAGYAALIPFESQSMP